MRSRCSEELFCVDNLSLVWESIEDLKGKLVDWKGSLERKRPKVDVKKTKIIISSEKGSKLRKKRKFP